MSGHDFRRSFSNNLVMQLFGLIIGKSLLDCNDPAAPGYAWCPVPFATVHCLLTDAVPRAEAGQLIGRYLWPLVAIFMGHQNPRTTAETYFQLWPFLRVALAEHMSNSSVRRPWDTRP